MIYMDHNATTPIHGKVVEAMLPFLWEYYGNPSSAHQMGAVVRDAVEKARASVAAVIGAKPEEIYFTSGATEANNLAIRGLVFAGILGNFITSTIEHHATLRTRHRLRSVPRNYTSSLVKVDERGQLDGADLLRVLGYHTRPLVSLMHANNETGNRLYNSEHGRIVKEAGGVVHVDAAQTFGKIPIQVGSLDIDMLSISGHKIYGPKGIGALYVREGIKLEPQITGGHQERDLRAGTENVPGIVGLGRAAELARTETSQVIRPAGTPGTLWIEQIGQFVVISALRWRTERLHEGLSAIDGALFNSFPEVNLGNTVNVSFDQVDGEALVMLLDQRGICVSHGAACESGTPGPSHVLKAMGRTDEEAAGAIRISLGIFNTLVEVEEVVEAISEIVKEVRA